MSYSNYPSASASSPSGQPPETKDNRKLIYGVLIAALLITWGYIIYDKNKSHEQYAQLENQYTTATSEKDSLDTEFKSALQRMDSLTGNNTQLQGKLSEKQTEIEKIKQEFAVESRKTNADRNKLRSLINQLNGRIDDYETQIAQLRAENEELSTNNRQLTVQRDSLTTTTQSLAQNLTASQEESARVTDVASTLHASNINIAAIDIKNSGKEKSTSKAKRADIFRVSFDLDVNRIAPSGSKELYIVVTSPDGKPITIPTSGSGEFQTRDEGPKVFTSKVVADYEQGKRTPVSFDWKQDNQYQTGNYKIEIYHNGYKIGEGTKSLKKSGLFG